ncbi:MAG: phosphoglyceromutase [Marivirga sp.]|nr:phosphoglyceromutase [Marivirga sp.]
MKILFLSYFILLVTLAQCQYKTENLVIVTIDGFRWQELFAGADSSILFKKEFIKDTSIRKQFWNTSIASRREKLLPFIWNMIGTQGQLYGNRNLNNRVDCANPYRFSYPGYSEMFTGLVDKRARSNKKITNPNYTLLEYINNQEKYKGKVAAFSTWDVIPYIIRASYACIPVNSGGMEALTVATTGGEAFLNNRQGMSAFPNDNQKDIFTFFFAFEFLKKERPRVLYLSFDETDEHAHSGCYGNYLRAAYNIDRMLSELWSWLQSDVQYKDKTTLLITTDHGRGKGSSNSWKKHGRLISGSGQVWFAALGPDTPAFGEMKIDSQYFQKQFAKTAAAFLGLDYSNRAPVGTKIHTMYSNNGFTTR